MFIDQDNSGTISTDELLYVMRSIGQNPTEDEVLELVMESDLNGDGTIDFEEFVEMMKKKSTEEDHREVLYFKFDFVLVDEIVKTTMRVL